MQRAGDFAPEHENATRAHAQVLVRVAVLQRHHCRWLRDRYQGKRKEWRYGGSGLETNQETRTQADVHAFAHMTREKDTTLPHENQTVLEDVPELAENLDSMNSENSRFED